MMPATGVMPVLVRHAFEDRMPEAGTGKTGSGTATNRERNHMPNTAHATWTGTLQQGNGKVALGQGAFEGDYSFKSRFEDGEGTNPEELIAAAHAACFSMATSAALGEENVEVESVDTDANVTLKMVDGTPTITRIVLTTTVSAPGADEETVRNAAEGAKKQCPVSRALAGVQDVQLDLTVNT